jgi:hypothetical protein
MPTPPQKPAEAAKPSNDSVEEKVGYAFLIVVLYFAAILVVPHFDPEKADIEKTADARAAIVKTFSQSFPAAEIQVKQLGAFSLEVWISKKNFESVGYLDRKALVESVGKGWCDLYGGWMFPTVAVRDEKSGKELAVYHSLFHNTTMEQE